MRDPLPSFPGYALRRAANATAAELAGRLTALGLRQSDVSVLILVAENPGVTASALGRGRVRRPPQGIAGERGERIAHGFRVTNAVVDSNRDCYRA